MKSPSVILSAILLLLAPVALAGTSRSSAHAAELAALNAGEDPMATVYVLTSRQTWESGLQWLGQGPLARRDSLGSELVIARFKAWQLGEVSHLVHEKQKRCGGFFAFSRLADAEAYLRNDRSAAALRSTLAGGYSIDNQATVNAWLPQVSESNLRSSISSLSTNWPNRYYASTHGQSAATWIRDQWLALASGRSDVSAELFTACGNCGGQPSVILTVQGAELPNEIVVLGGHLDSISNVGSGDSMNAPGADDDASGIATLTEIIRIALANGWKPKRTVKFMGYAAEEVGLRGSYAIAQSYKAQGKNVVGVLQLDMTNYRGGSGLDMRLITDYSNADLKSFSNSLFDAYLVPLGMARGTYTCGYGCSDHASWTGAGFPAVMMYEAGNYQYLHTTSDTLATMGNNANASIALAKFGLAFLGELAKTTGGSNQPPVANFSVLTNGLTANFSDSSSDSDGSIVTRNWSFGDGGSSSASSPSWTYAAPGTYNVTLTVTDDDGAGASKTTAVTVSSSSGTNVLQNGVAVPGLAASTGNSLNYSMEVPAGASNLKFVIGGGTGNADLYVKFGSGPNDTSYDCRPYRLGNSETCEFAGPQAGTWFVRVKARSGFSGLSLTGSYTAPGGGGGGGSQTYSNNTVTPLPDQRTTSSSIAVSGRSGNASSNSQVSVNISHPRRGDLRISLVAPDGSNYQLKPSNSSDTAADVVATYAVNLSSEPLNGTWKLRITDTAAGNSGTLNSWSLQF
jgi:leucyl aminopeptidase